MKAAEGKPHKDIDGLADTQVANSTGDVFENSDLESSGLSSRRGRTKSTEATARPASYHGPGTAYDSTLPIEQAERYQVSGEHARGGLGRVLMAYDERLGRTVAIKELLKASTFAESLFVREALITARLQHPGIVPVHEAGRWPTGDPFYVMKLVSGKSMQEIIRAKSTVAERMELLTHVIDVVETIAYAHSQGILHRDIKPANIMIGEFGETVVIDWGLARDDRQPVPPVKAVIEAAMESGSGMSFSSTDSVWHTSGNYSVSGKVVGTPAYMSPEQARGEEVDERSDVYALGALLYEVLSGKAPYPGKKLQVVLERVIKGPPTPLAERLAETHECVKPDLLTIVGKAMARDRNDRYPTVKALAEDLKRFQTGQLVTAHEYSTWTLVRRWLWRNRAPVGVALAAAVVLAITGVISINRIVEQRNIATAERAQARVAQHEAEKSRNSLLFLQAEESLPDDPTTTVAWLKNAPLGGAHFARARALYEDALARGVSRHVLRLDGVARALTFTPDGRHVLIGAHDGALRLVDVDSGNVRIIDSLEDAFNAVALSPDGKWVAAGTDTGALRVRELGPAGDDEVRTLMGHAGVVTRVQFSADGSRLVSLGGDGTARIWNPATGEQIAEHAVGKPAALSDDLRFLAGMIVDKGDDGKKGTVFGVWELGSAREVARFPLSMPVHDAVFSADGKKLALVAKDGTLTVHDLASGESGEFGSVVISRSLKSNLVSFSPSGRWLATPGEAYSIVIWDLESKQPRSLHGHRDGLYRLRFVDDSTLVSASDDATLRIWDLCSASVQELHGHTDDVWRFALAPKGDLIASAGLDQSVRIWSIRPSRAMRLDDPKAGEFTGVAFADDDTLVSGASHGAVHTWSLSDGTPKQLAPPRDGKGTAHRMMSPDGRHVLVQDHRDERTELWDTATGTLRTLEEHKARVRHVAFAADYRGVVSMDVDGKVVIWSPEDDRVKTLQRDPSLCFVALSPGSQQVALFSPKRIEIVDVNTGESISEFERLGLTTNCHDEIGRIRASYSPGGNWLAVTSDRSGLVFWNAEQRRWRRVKTGRYQVQMLKFSPDESQLALSVVDRSIRMIDVATGEMRTIGRHADLVYQIVFSPDGKTLASSSYDDTIRLWSTHSDEHRLLRGHSGGVYSINFSADGTRLASAARDGTLRVWELEENVVRDPTTLEQRLDSSTTAVVSPRMPVHTPSASAPVMGSTTL